MMSVGTREAVVAAAGLGRSSSRVADCNSLKPEVSENGNAREIDNKPPSATKQNLFSCLVASSVAAAKKKKTKTNSTHHQWPRSPSHLMSRLLLSPDMTPMASPAAAAGDHSPARSKRHKNRAAAAAAAAQREFFSGPLLGGGGSSTKKEMFEAAKDEPTSPKVTCMGTVKAPKKHKDKAAAATRRNSRPPKWRESIKNFSGPLDLNRFGQISGELAPPSSSSKKKKQQQQQVNCVFGKSLLALQQQEEQKEWESTTDWPSSLKNLRIVVQRRDAGEVDARWKKSLTIDSSNNCLEKNSSEMNEQQQPAMRKAEEICIWKRRSIAEPMKLDIRRN